MAFFHIQRIQGSLVALHKNYKGRNSYAFFTSAVIFRCSNKILDLSNCFLKQLLSNHSITKKKQQSNAERFLKNISVI